MYDKSIQYDRETRDYAMRLDGELVGFARTYHEAEVTLDQLVYDLLSDGLVCSASELDPPAPEPPIVIVEAPDPTPPESRCATCGGEGDCPDCDGGGGLDAMARPRYTRAPSFDNPRHGDAWRDEFGLLRWVAVGSDPNINNPVRV